MPSDAGGKWSPVRALQAPWPRPAPAVVCHTRSEMVASKQPTLPTYPDPPNLTFPMVSIFATRPTTRRAAPKLTDGRLCVEGFGVISSNAITLRRNKNA